VVVVGALGVDEGASGAGVGITAAGIAGIVTSVVPNFVGSSTELAVTRSCVSVSIVLIISTPLAVIVVVAVPPTPSTFHVTSWPGLPVPSILAVKVWPSPLFICGLAGVTVTEVTVGIVTAMEPDFAVFILEVAMT